MATKRRAVYDYQNYFSRFLKYEFRKTVEFDSFKNFKSLENTIKEYSTIIFVIYSEEEIVNLMSIYKKGIPLIVCTFNEKLLLKLRNIDEILLLDTSKVKSEVIAELRTYLNITEMTLVA